MPNLITLTGFAEFEAKLQNIPKKLQNELGQVAKFAADTWEQLAKKDAPVDQGRLRNEIKAVKLSNIAAEVVVNSEQAPWIEWGTRSRVRVPAELVAYASQFKGKGSTLKGKGTAKEMIFAWCKRKGIDKKAWYSIYRSIMINGIRPHPFFFIQRPKVEKQFTQDVRDILTSLD